jgi:hypothetical protein
MEHPVDDDPPDDGNRQADNNGQTLGEWGHFSGDEQPSVGRKQIEMSEDPTLGTRTSRRQRVEVDDCPAGRRQLIA